MTTTLPDIAKASSRGESLKPLAVSIRRACELVGLGNTTIWKMIKEGRLQTMSVGRRRLVIYRSLEALVSASEEASGLMSERSRNAS
jgi:excisionase family DNA binding protein